MTRSYDNKQVGDSPVPIRMQSAQELGTFPGCFNSSIAHFPIHECPGCGDPSNGALERRAIRVTPCHARNFAMVRSYRTTSPSPRTALSPRPLNSLNCSTDLSTTNCRSGSSHLTFLSRPGSGIGVSRPKAALCAFTHLTPTSTKHSLWTKSINCKLQTARRQVYPAFVSCQSRIFFAVSLSIISLL